MRDEQGNMLMWMGSAVDIHETRQLVFELECSYDKMVELSDQLRLSCLKAEAERKMLEQLNMKAPVLFCVVRGAEHRYELVNEKYQQLMPNRELVGKKGAEVFPELARQGFVGIMDQVYATGKDYVAENIPVLVDRARGRERAMREIAAGVVNPVRGLNRLLQGKSFQVTAEDSYETQPLNFTLFAGVHRLNEQENDVFGKGGNNAMLSMQLDYGRPFEHTRRKPFDVFLLRAEFSTGKGDTLASRINNVTDYGVLAGHNFEVGRLALLTGAFQYYDYWNTRNFELGALGFGGGVFSKLEFQKHINLYTNAHLGVIPLAGNSTRSAPDALGLRSYVFATGLQGKIESTMSLGKYASAALVYYHFWLNTFEGLEGRNSIGIVRPRVTVQLYKNVSLGYEHFGYTTDRTLEAYPGQRSVITEQKIFLQLFLEAPDRRGHYN